MPARSDLDYCFKLKRIVQLLFLCITQAILVGCCNPNSLELQSCVNIYLERDFPLLQIVLQRQNTGRPMLLDGPDLKVICDQIKYLLDCQVKQLPKCHRLDYVANLRRAIMGVKNVMDTLCVNNTHGLRELLAEASCIARVGKAAMDKCDVRQDFNWMITVVRMLRLQDGAEACPELLAHHQCMIKGLKRSNCRRLGLPAYNNTVFPWLKVWCSSASDIKPFYNQYLLMLFTVMFTVRFL